MASNAMDPSIGVTWEEQFKCCICLDVLADPVSTPCGHNFCMVCIDKCWTSGEEHHCPLCKEKFDTKPELKVNTTFRAVVHHFQKRKGDSRSAVPCDVCTGQAVKSCLDCGTTFCETHLENHKSAPKLIRHKLVDPVENLENYICQKHEKPLVMFCRNDQMSVCKFCTETEHKNHNTVPIEQESGEKKKHLRKEQEEIQQTIKHRKKMIQDIHKSLKLNKEVVKKSKAYSVEMFRDLVRCMEKSQAELLEVMEEKQKAAERKAAELTEDLEQEITELKRRGSELEQLSHTQDHVHLLQIYPSLCKTLHTMNRTDFRMSFHLNLETLKKALSQLQGSLYQELRSLSKIMHKSALQHKDKPRNAFSLSTTTPSSSNAGPPFGCSSSAAAPAPFTPLALNAGLGDLRQKYAVNVTLDPETAYPRLVLSADRKQVWHGYTWQDVPNNPERFDTNACVLGKENFSSGRSYYEVEVRGMTAWVLGVVQESVNRKGMIEISPKNGYWTVHLRNEMECLALTSRPVILSLMQVPQKVGIFVDYENGLVSFYDAGAKTQIYSFTGQSFSENLYPFFLWCK